MKDDNVLYKSTSIQSADKQLVFELIRSMYAGIALMAQAQHKQVNPDVIDLAEKLQTNHTKLTEELKMYASEQGWLIPAGENEEDSQNRAAMAKIDGDEYQRKWLAALRNRHETNITRLENAAPEDTELQKMGEKGLSKLEDLLSDIINVQETVA